MTEVRGGWRIRRRSFVVDSIVLVGLVLAIVGSGGAARPPVPFELLANTAPHPSAAGSGANLTVDPPTFWMRTGSNVTLQAVWSVGSPLCSVTPLWYRWTVGHGTATGFLNTTTGPSPTFTADSFDSGTVTVTVRSGAVLVCGGNETALEQTRGANLSIVVPLRVPSVKLGPNPLLPGETATLAGTIAGGEPPYTLDVTWGDGTGSVLSVPSPGPFSVNHTFAAGEFAPYVLASDSEGDSQNVSVVEGLSVGTGLRVAIDPARYVAEVGVPAVFEGIVDGPSAGTVPLFDCSNATSGPAVPPVNDSNETAFSCTFTAAGTAEVLFGVFPTEPGGPSASAVLYEHVVAPPELSVEATEAVGEVGTTALVPLRLSGGALPLTMSWNLSGNRSGGTETVDSDGGGVLALPLTFAGEYSIGVRANDSLGAVAVNGTATVRVEPPLVAHASGVRTLRSYGAVVGIALDVLSGCPTFDWWVVPAVAPANGSTESGILGDLGDVVWNGSYAQEGNLSLSVGIADGCGVTWQADLEVPLVPMLEVEVAVAPGPPSSTETVEVNLSLQGGWPPFRLDVNASDNESWNRTAFADGMYRWLLPTQANGSTAVQLLVTDRLGETVEIHRTLVLVAAPEVISNSTGSSTTNLAGPIAVLALVGAIPLGMFLWRRRSRKPPSETSGPDPVATLRRIIEPAEGAERFTVELLAEEAGIPLAIVRSTIDRLVSEGRVQSESGADGEEVLSWSSTTGH